MRGPSGPTIAHRSQGTEGLGPGGVRHALRFTVSRSRGACVPQAADNGSNWYVSGVPDDCWNNDALSSELRQVQGSNFDVLRMDGLLVG